MTYSLTVLGVAAGSVDDLVLGLSEACTNVIDHADVDDDYEVHLHLDALFCTMNVIDKGGAFCEASPPDRPVSDAAEQGRGVAIMRAVMDRVDFVVDPGTKTLVYLAKTVHIDPHGPLARLA